jgi:2-polyprenyl-3-methyl-5-hydroxy-6-metoxy-1,4-benzoquinol methylase
MEYALDEDAVVAFAEKVGADQAIVLGAALAYVGDRLGLWAALAAAGPATSAELAAQTGLTERYLREWLAAQAAAGYLDHDAGRFTLSPERAAVLGIEGSPAAMAGGFELAAAIWAGTGQLAEAFRTGRGISWAEQDPRLAGAVDRCFRANYAASLVDEWLPALDGVVAKLEAGARVLDVGCGHGTATVMIAEAFPQAAVHGVDPLQPSVRAAEHAAVAARARATFAIGTATDYAADGWDVVFFLDALHDMGDPLAAALHARTAVADDGTVVFVEPAAADRLDDNLHPIGLTYYAASTALCVPQALSQTHEHDVLGAQAGTRRLAELLAEAGFSRVREAARTDLHVVIEARP